MKEEEEEEEKSDKHKCYYFPVRFLHTNPYPLVSLNRVSMQN